MKPITFIVALSLALTLSACFHTQLTGPVGASTIDVAPLRDPHSIVLSGVSWDVDEWIKRQGQSEWDGYTPLFQLLVVGISLPNTDMLDAGSLYIVTAAGGMDYDADAKLTELSSNPVAVQGSWHAIATGERIMAGNLKVSALTEAIYRQVLPNINIYTDNEILARLEAAAQLLVADVGGDDEVSYDDVLIWNRTVFAAGFLGDLEALDQLATAITAGQPQDMLAALAEAVYSSHRITMVTNFGTIEMETLNWDAPITVANFLDYINSDYYDQVIFHRVIEDFIIQAGWLELVGPTSVNAKPTNAPIYNEAISGVSNRRGNVAMARTNNPHSASSQFFINQVNNTFLDYKDGSSDGYAVFARVLSGMDVVDTIAALPTATISGIGEDVPNEIVVIESVTINN